MRTRSRPPPPEALPRSVRETRKLNIRRDDQLELHSVFAEQSGNITLDDDGDLQRRGNGRLVADAL